MELCFGHFGWGLQRCSFSVLSDSLVGIDQLAIGLVAHITHARHHQDTWQTASSAAKDNRLGKAMCQKKEPANANA